MERIILQCINCSKLNYPENRKRVTNFEELCTIAKNNIATIVTNDLYCKNCMETRIEFKYNRDFHTHYCSSRKEYEIININLVPNNKYYYAFNSTHFYVCTKSMHTEILIKDFLYSTSIDEIPSQFLLIHNNNCNANEILSKLDEYSYTTKPLVESLNSIDKTKWHLYMVQKKLLTKSAI